MTEKPNNYQLLIQRLDQFTRKYYINQIIRGALFSTGLVILLFLTVALLEHFFYFSTNVRKLLFFSFLATAGVAITSWIIIPLAHYFKLGKIISREFAAVIIGNHFAEVKDKLLNILDLKNKSFDEVSAELVNASIDQKIQELNPVPFQTAINLNKNRKYLKYALPPCMLLLAILLASPGLIPSSTARLLKNNVSFERPAPFSFELQNQNMRVVQFEDFTVDLKVSPKDVGGALPNEVFINVDNYQYKLTKNSPTSFSYRMSKVAKETKFFFSAGGFDSKDYDLDVLKKPNIVGFDIRLDYPGYTGRKDEIVANIGDMVVPVGTQISWSFESQNTDRLDVRFGQSDAFAETQRNGTDRFTMKKRASKDESYTIYISNEDLENADSVSYSISVIPDLYPSISVEQFPDSLEQKLFYFVGDASDDYGLKSLHFNYQIDRSKKDKPSGGTNIPVPFKSGNQAQYDFTWDMQELGLEPGDKLTYYFEVFDNDGVNGSKSSRTSLMNYAMPTVEEFEKMEEDNNTEIKDNLEQSLQEARDLREEMKELKNKLVQKKELDWQDKKELEKMMERQKELEKKMQKAQENFKDNQKNQKEFEQTKESILEKQEKIQKLFDELMNEEMKELMRKIEELMDELTKDEAIMDLEDMELSDEELEKELDRLLELFKELEMEHQLEQTVEKLEELAKEEEELSEESKESNPEDKAKQEELEEKQEELNEKFDKVQEELDKLEEMNKELSNPKDLGDTEKEQEEIDKDMEKSSEELEQKQNQKASQSQKNASDKMKKMAQQMRSQMASAQMEQLQEDIESLRQLLENLVDMSFDQEKVMNEIQESNINTPNYVKLVQDQYKLKDDFKLIEDSLQALSKRVFQIEAFVTEKVTNVKKNLKQSLDDLEERKKSAATVQQQYAMTGVNDLALMLSEVMEQMQQQMANQMPGSQMCQNPGQGQSGKGKGKSMMKLGDMQQQLNDQLSKMKDEMGKGKGKGKGKNGMSKEFAEAAAKQAALRKALKEMQQEKQQQGQGSEDLQKLIDEMDKTETDLVNKRLTNEMMKRQEEILTRLLESAKAEREREMEEKRESETGQVKERKMPPSLEEYIKKREAEVEMYKAVSPDLKPYYKSLVEDYFESLKKKSR